MQPSTTLERSWNSEAALSQGNRAAARACWEQSLALAPAIQDHDPSVMAHLNLARLELDQGHLTLSSNRLDAVPALAQKPVHGMTAARLLVLLGNAAGAQRREGLRASVYQRALAVVREFLPVSDAAVRPSDRSDTALGRLQMPNGSRASRSSRSARRSRPAR